MIDTLFRIVPVDETNVVRITDIFRSIYGDDFPVENVYQPDILWGEIRAGRLFSVLAFDPEGQPAGYIAMVKVAPNPRLWEGANLLVIPQYGQTDLSSRLVHRCVDLAANLTGTLDGIFAEAVCCHYFSQLNMAKNGMVDCGLELDQLDGNSFKDGKSNKAGTARVSCVLSFWEVTDPPEPEYLPTQYKDIVERIAEGLRPRNFLLSTARMPAHGTTVLKKTFYAAARTLKVAVPVVGGDWPEVVEDILDTARKREVISLQITVNTDCAHISAVVDVLRARGFFFGGMAPRWFGTDGILMQKLFGSETEYEKTKLYTDMAKRLLSFIKSDREAVRGE